jgi:transaldolase
MLGSPEMRPVALAWARKALGIANGINEAAALTQRYAIEHLLPVFRPLYDSAPGYAGFVSLQIDPHAEDDPDNIVREALEGIKMGPNYIAKIPVTAAGLAAIGELVRKNVPIIATEIMSVSQTVAVCETYKKVSEASGQTPAFFVTNIAGIFDQSLREQYDAGNFDIKPEILSLAGVILGRRQYKLMCERGYPGIMMGGGARGTHHFTEFVGGNVHITINWKNAADVLIERDEPIVNRMDTPTPDYVLDELMRFKDFKMAYIEDGLDTALFESFAPIKLFRDIFVDGWNELINELEFLR